LGKLVGLGREAVGYRRNRPLFKEAVAEMLMPARSILIQKAPAITRRMADMAIKGDDDLAVRAGTPLMRIIFPSRVVLTDGDGGPVTPGETRAPITMEDLEKAEAAEARARAGAKPKAD
jgi:hypothetical protein